METKIIINVVIAAAGLGLIYAVCIFISTILQNQLEDEKKAEEMKLREEKLNADKIHEDSADEADNLWGNED